MWTSQLDDHFLDTSLTLTFLKKLDALFRWHWCRHLMRFFKSSLLLEVCPQFSQSSYSVDNPKLLSSVGGILSIVICQAESGQSAVMRSVLYGPKWLSCPKNAQTVSQTLKFFLSSVLNNLTSIFFFLIYLLLWISQVSFQNHFPDNFFPQVITGQHPVLDTIYPLATWPLLENNWTQSWQHVSFIKPYQVCKYIH